jgi:hypothetical protein
MRHMYMIPILDEQKVMNDARKKSEEEHVLLHFHAEGDHCEDSKHQMYFSGVVIDEWGINELGTAPQGS